MEVFPVEVSKCILFADSEFIKERRDFLKAFLLPVGRQALNALPSLLATQAMGATQLSAREASEPLRIFLLDQEAPDASLSGVIDDLNACYRLFSGVEDRFFFPLFYRFSSFQLQLNSLREPPQEGPEALLLSALRGKGVPLSAQSDWEAVDWAVSALLSAPESENSSGLTSLIHRLQQEINLDCGTRIAILFDPTDPFSAGVTLPLLQALRQELASSSPLITLIGLTVRPVSAREELSERLQQVLTALSDRQ